jgi:spore germination cell wall hydrolase CwlJ-like protein
MAGTLHPRDSLIKAALTPAQCVGMTVWAESRAEPIEGQVAVACVIRNRLLLPKRFDDTWKEVCLAKWQFSCWIPQGGEANYQMLMTRCDAAMRGQHTWPAQAMWIAEGIISNALLDRVSGATHYFASWMPKPPKWAEGIDPVAVIGVHRFYKGV